MKNVFFKFGLMVIGLLLITACVPGNGILSVKINDGGRGDLHAIYEVMKSNGFLMKKRESTETYPDERWGVSDSDGLTSGGFLNADFKSLVVVVMYFHEDKNTQEKPTLFVFFDESPVGFSEKGKALADQVLQSLRDEFGGQVVITEERNYEQRD